MGAREQLQQLHWQRGQIVSESMSASERVLDTGSARAEEVPDRPRPSGNEDFGGFLVVTDEQLIYHDYFGTTAIPWEQVRNLDKERFRGLMTTGLRVTFTDGSQWLFSGNTPFVKQLVRMWKRS